MKYKVRNTFFLGEKLPKQGPISIIGAGIAGLLTGYYLRKAGYDFEIIERNAKVGGLLGTKKGSYGLAEQAANGFLWIPEMQGIADDLGLEVIAPQATAKKRFLVRNGRLRRFPLSIIETATMAGKMLLPHGKYLETAADFGDTYFGAAVTRQLVSPGLTGIYGADADQLSFPGALGRVAAILNQSDSFPLALFKNRRANKSTASSPKRRVGTHGFREGMGALVNALAEYLKDHIRLHTDGLDYVDQQNHLIITTPASISHQFFKGQLSRLLQEVKYTPLVTATLFFERKDLLRFQDGFGCLIPRGEGLQILGVLFNSSIFPNRSKDSKIISLTCILRQDANNPTLLEQTDEALQRLIQKDLDHLFQLKAPAKEVIFSRWPQAIPVYSPKLYQDWYEMDRLLKENYPNRQLFGNYTGQISIRGMCEAAAREIG